MSRPLTIFTVLLLIMLPLSLSAQTVWSPSLLQVEQSTPTGTVDIIVESDSYVPTTYRGRAEPIPGGTVRLIAILGQNPPSSPRYTWIVNGSTLEGKESVIIFNAPNIGNQLRIELRVLDENGRLWAEQNELVALSEPEIVFHEYSLLTGQSKSAIGSVYSLIGSETTIVAQPYFVDRGTFSRLGTSWKLNGSLISDDDDDWRTISITNAGLRSNNTVSLELVDRVKLTDIKASFSLNLGL